MISTNSIRLLVKRDKTLLVGGEGQAFVEDVPDFLKSPKVVSPDKIKIIENRHSDENLLILNQTDYDSIDHNLNHRVFQYLNFLRRKKLIPGIWSGYRSALVKDPKTNSLFKLKGVVLNPLDPQITEFEDGTFWIEGGQKQKNLVYEKEMSDKFNRVLLDNGIQPVMTYKGMWKYPTLIKRNRPAASIYQVEGDTRLDELMFALESWIWPSEKFINYVSKDKEERCELYHSSKGKKFFDTLKKMYYDIGFVTGSLKRLMDKNGQTWSCDSDRTNSHIENIVVYNGTNKLKVGFVDFDASCDSRDGFSKSEIRDLQKKEYEIIQRSVNYPSSMRKIKGKLINRCFTNSRKKFLEGFQKGYSCNKKKVSNEVDIGLIEEIFSLIRKDEALFLPVSQVLSQRTEDIAQRLHNLNQGIQYDSHKISLRDAILGNKYFQDEINKNNGSECMLNYNMVKTSLKDAISINKYSKNTIDSIFKDILYRKGKYAVKI